MEYLTEHNTLRSFRSSVTYSGYILLALDIAKICNKFLPGPIYILSNASD